VRPFVPLCEYNRCILSAFLNDVMARINKLTGTYWLHCSSVQISVAVLLVVVMTLQTALSSIARKKGKFDGL